MALHVRQVTSFCTAAGNQSLTLPKLAAGLSEYIACHGRTREAGQLLQIGHRFYLSARWMPKFVVFSDYSSTVVLDALVFAAIPEVRQEIAGACNLTSALCCGKLVYDRDQTK